MGLRIVILQLFLCMVFNSVQSQNWNNYIVLGDDGMYHLYWNPPADKRGDSEINFKVKVKAEGCFVLGLSPDGGLPGSDIVSGWITEGEVYFQDRHADETGLLIIDDQQDYKLIAAYENDTSTVFEFHRKLDTCDVYDKVIDQSTMRVIYSYSDDCPALNPNNSFSLKDDPGTKSVLLLQYKPQNELDGLLQWDLTATDVNLPSTPAYHWCKIVKPPNITEKHHIVNIHPLIQKGNENFVYHLVFYECRGGSPDKYEDLLDEDVGYECYQPNTPPEMYMCQGLIGAWVTGQGDIPLPDKAGYGIYPDRFYMLEVSYINRQLKSGIIDSSGFRFHYTRNLRDYDAGNYVIGTSISPRMFIPPRQKEYIVAGHSNPYCVQKGWTDRGGKCFAVLFHSRFIGRRMKIRHFRGNEELTPLMNDKNYDSNYQPYRYTAEEVTILPNDQITLECTYDSTNRSTVSLGGWLPTSEVCTTLLMYYPLVPGDFSFSAPSFANINMVLKTNITKEEDVIPMLESVDWSNVDIDNVQNVMRYGEKEAQCYHGPFRLDEEPTLMSYPKDLIPFEQQSTCNATK